jgi:hypothetical protein
VEERGRESKRQCEMRREEEQPREAGSITKSAPDTRRVATAP